MQVLESLVVVGSKFCLPHIGAIVAHRGYTMIFQTCSRIRWRIVVLFGIREVRTYIGLQLQMVYHLPLCICIGNDAGVGGRCLDIVQVGDGVTYYRLSVANEDVLTDGSDSIVVRAISIIDGLCGWGNQSRHPAVGCPLGRLTGVAVVHIT